MTVVHVDWSVVGMMRLRPDIARRAVPLSFVLLIAAAACGSGGPLEFTCASPDGVDLHSRVSRGVDPPLNSRAANAPAVCAFDEEITRVEIRYEEILREGGGNLISRDVAIDPPASVLKFPLEGLADSPVGEDVAIGSYGGNIVAVSKSGKRAELFLRRGNTTQHMHVVENVKGAQALLDPALETWRDAGLRGYSMTLDLTCFGCPEETIFLRVENGVITSAVTEGAGRLRSALLFTVDDLFDEIQDGIDERFLAIEVKYDAELGYPTSIFFDQDEGVDDEFRFTVSGVVVAPGPALD